MARVFVVTDDIDGSPDAETVEFSLRGTRYEIDLAEKNAAKLEKALADFIGHARKVGSGTPTSSGRSSRGGGQRAKRDPEQLNAIRAWARENGYEVSDRGRIAANIEDAYNEAHK